MNAATLILRIRNVSASAQKVADLTTEALAASCRSTAEQAVSLARAVMQHSRMAGADARDASRNMEAAMLASCRIDTLRRAGLTN